MPLSAGIRLGPYEVQGAIGAGAMGEVYRARDTNLNRPVAIKLLSAAHAADEVALGRFEREARLASSLNHPNILTIYAVGRTDDGEPYIAMELIEGRTLADVLADGRMPMRRIADIAAQMAAGLSSAHRAGVVHRDIKPQNVMVRSDGLVKIVDFGLSVLGQSALSEAETAAVAPQLSRTGVITGTISYMSPEQAAGHVLDFRSDQFSFGSVLYEMAAGRRPFNRATGAQTMAAIIAEPHEAVTQYNADVPDAIERTIERCLSKNPAERYESTEDLAREMLTTRDRLSGTRTVSTAGEGARRRGSRHWPWGVTAAVVVVVAGIAVAPVISARWFGAQTSAAVEREQLAVLPFANVGNDPAGQPFVDGLIETLTSQLGQVAQSGGKLDVVPASDVRATKVASVSDARNTFGVGHALTGSVQRTGNHVRITVNLVDARTLRTVDARTLDSELQDVVAMQDDTVRQIAELVGASLQPAAAQALKLGGTAVTAAYESYLQGRGHLQRYEKLDSVDLAIADFQRAIAADPKYAQAHAGLGEAYWRKYQLTKDSRWPDAARASCDRALELDDRLAAAHLTLGMIDVGTGKASGAVTELSRVISLDPLNADAHRELGNAYGALGKSTEAEASYKRALEIRPNSWANHNDLGRFYFVNLHKYADAEVQYQRVIDLMPDSDVGYRTIGAVYYATQRFDLAEQFFRKSVAIQPNESAYSNLGTLYYAQARYADAARMLEQASQFELSQHNSRIWVNLASALYWAPGERAKAQAAYTRALALARDELRVAPNDRGLLFRIADCQSRLGQPAESRRVLAQALSVAPPPTASDLFSSGVIYEQLGDRARALASIQKAIDGGFPRDRVERSPDLANLRADARFLKR